MFSADILTTLDRSQIGDEAIQSILDQNGFIISVLGRKRLTIDGILEQIQSDKDMAEDPSV